MPNQITLPVDRMLADAQAAWTAIESGTPARPDLFSDLACHVMALADELRKASEACAFAYRHLDTYGVVSGPNIEIEVESQNRLFELLSPYVGASNQNPESTTEGFR